MRTKVLFSMLSIFLVAILAVGSLGASTFIKCEVQNGSDQRATGYNFVMLTPGTIDKGSLEGRSTLVPSQRSATKMSWKLPDGGVAPGDRLEFRTQFTPERYWDVYFVDYFNYESGAVQRSDFPYAAFFISFTPTDDPEQVMATLTVVNNVAASYGVNSKEIADAHGISAKLVNDEGRRPIEFKNINVWVDNDMGNYTLETFDTPSGRLLKLPDSFSLAPGEVRNFNLGKVAAGAYILTSSTIAYEGEEDDYPVTCGHAPPKTVEAVSTDD